MPKSGSSLLRYYIREMINLVSSEAQLKLNQLIHNKIIAGKGHFLNELNNNIIDQLLSLIYPDKQLLIKVHLDFSSGLDFLTKNHSILMTYSYRDPRDVILSAMDHYKRARENGTNEFETCDTFENTARTVLRWSENAVKWINSGSAFNINYEYFLENKIEVLRAVNEKAGFGLNDQELNNIIKKEIETRQYGKNQFNTGKTNRYHEEMTEKQINFCNQLFADVIPVLSKQSIPLNKPV